MSSYLLRGYVIPPSFRSHVKWVNSTPHLSHKAANLHRDSLIKLGKNADMSKRVHEWLSKAGVRGADEAYALYQSLGPLGSFKHVTNITPAAAAAHRFMMQMIKEPEDQWKQDPTLAHTDYIKVINALNNIINEIPDSGFKKFEKKSFLKYVGDASRRNYEGYVDTVRQNYHPARDQFMKRPLPKMDAYELALDIMASRYDDDISEDDKYQRLLDQGDFIARSRHDTTGGAPYYKNMGDFLSNKDDNDLTTWADKYNELALIWLMLPVKYKVAVSSVFTYLALERVQAGGATEFTGHETSLDEILSKLKPNKQRFVQAESAIFPKAFKAPHDIMLDKWKSIPHLAADKWSEELTSESLKEISLIGLRNKMRVQGADWTNYDASIEVCILNDVYFNRIRNTFPDWFNSYVVDPYFEVAFKTPVFVSGIGLFLSTGVKSGMIITNQGDCFMADFCDIYEIVRYWQERGATIDEIRSAIFN